MSSVMSEYAARMLFMLCGLCFITVEAESRNPFDAAHGCLLFDSVPGYNETLEYFATDNFQYVGTTHNSKYIRVGMIGKSDGIIRLSKSRFPYGESLSEITLSGLAEQMTEVNRHTRTSDSEYINTLVKSISTPKILSKTRPLMFRVEIFDNGDVHLTRDGERTPFVEFNDHNSKSDLNYIAFTRWNIEVFYFYDCPLNPYANNVDDTVLLRCDLA